MLHLEHILIQCKVTHFKVDFFPLPVFVVEMWLSYWVIMKGSRISEFTVTAV